MRMGEEPTTLETQAAISIQNLCRTRLAKKRQAALRIQKAYKTYLSKKNTLDKLPAETLHLIREKISHKPGMRFLLSNLRPDDYFLTSRAGSKSLMHQLKKGNYQLLLFYLRNGRSLLPHIYEAFFSGNCSVEMLAFVSFLQSMAPHLTQETCPGDKIDCFPILTQDESQLTLEAQRLLVPYLKQNFKTIGSHHKLLKMFSKTRPLEERVFAIAELSFEFHIASIKMLLLRLNREKNTDSYIQGLDKLSIYTPVLKIAEPSTQLSLLLNTLDELIATRMISETLVEESIKQLELFYPLVSGYTKLNHLYFQIVFASNFVAEHVVWRGRFSQIIIAPTFLSRYADFIFSSPQEKFHEAIIACPGFGEFTAMDIKTATQANERIIYLESPHVRMQNLVHDATDGFWANALHDLGHLARMCMIPFSVRKGLEALAELIHTTTQFPLSKMTYRLFDMDIANFSTMLADTQKNPIENIRAIVAFYRPLMKFLPRYLEYHLIITFEMLRNSQIIHDIFSHCEIVCSPTQLQDLFLASLCPESDPHFGNTVNYKDIKKNFKLEFSTTQNVFLYLLSEVVKSKKLDSGKEASLIALVTQLNDVFKWTRNSGLKIVGFYVRDINNQNYDAVMSALKILAFMQDKTELVNAISTQELTQTALPFSVPSVEIDGLVDDTMHDSFAQYYQKSGTRVFFSRAADEARHLALPSPIKSTFRLL